MSSLPRASQVESLGAGYWDGVSFTVLRIARNQKDLRIFRFTIDMVGFNFMINTIIVGLSIHMRPKYADILPSFSHNGGNSQQ